MSVPREVQARKVPAGISRRTRILMPCSLLLVALLSPQLGCRNARSNASFVPDPAGDMIQIPEGTFTMGSVVDDSSCDNPVHSVHLKTFAIDVTEVTVAAYRRCVAAGQCTTAGDGDGCNWGLSDHEKHPINCVDFEQAAAFCKWANKRLPTDDEWECAARGPDALIYPWGDAPPTDQLCWRRKTSNLGTCPVGAYASDTSPWGSHGLRDMAGNVMEWVGHGQRGRMRGAGGSGYQFVRGADWTYSNPKAIRLSSRGWLPPHRNDAQMGFRCAKSAEAPTK